jgi:predicted RNA-binding protein YlxR (DUF448 family)
MILNSGKLMLIRKCIGCGKQKNKFDFIRINRTPKTDLKIKITVLDKGEIRHLSGRSAYICDNPECFKRIKKSRRRLEKSFSYKINESVYDEILKKLLTKMFYKE